MLPQLPGLVLSSQPKPQHTNFQPKTPPAASPGFSLFPNYRDLFLWPPWARSKPGQLRESFHSLLDLSSWSFSYNKLPIICWFLFNYPPEAADISLPRSLGARRRLPVHSQAPKLGTVGSVGLCPRFFGAEYSQNQTQGGEFWPRFLQPSLPWELRAPLCPTPASLFLGKKPWNCLKAQLDTGLGGIWGNPVPWAELQPSGSFGKMGNWCCWPLEEGRKWRYLLGSYPLGVFPGLRCIPWSRREAGMF